MMEHPIKMDDLGVPLFSENIHKPIYRNTQRIDIGGANLSRGLIEQIWAPST